MQTWADWIKGKKIVFFVAETVPSFAGGGRNAFYFARFLASAGANSTITCLNYNNRLPKKQVIEHVQIQRVAYYNRNVFTKFFSLFILICNYIKLVKSSDVLFLYGRFLPGYIIILIAGNLFHKLTVFRSTLLNDDDIKTIKTCAGLLWPVYKFAFNNISLYYAINRKLAEKWQAVFQDTVPMISSVQGVDASVFNRSAVKSINLSKESEELVILSCGILIERKGYRQIFQALSQLDIPFRYIVIGQYLPDKYHRSSIIEVGEMESLFKLGKKLLGDRVVFINTTENTSDYYAGADIFIHMAKDESPNVLFEAMAMGLPVIARRSDGLTHAIRQGENVELFSSENEICNLIKKLGFNREYSRNLGKMAANTIEKECTFNHIAAKIVETLNLD
jgi:glycosyltransferase involved in cell wall biosynthesis